MADKPRAIPPEKIEARPCLTEAAMLLLGALATGATVWEFGSGGSTLWLADLAFHVTSIEDNAAWYEAVKETLLDRGYAGIDLRLTPTKMQPDAITGEGLYDVVFVDCLRQEERRRSVILGALHVKPGGWLVADDYTFPLTNKAVEGLRAQDWDVGIVAGIKTHPIRKVPYATSTAFCHKPG